MGLHVNAQLDQTVNRRLHRINYFSRTCVQVGRMKTRRTKRQANMPEHSRMHVPLVYRGQCNRVVRVIFQQGLEER